MKVNNIPFLVTMDGAVKFRTTAWLKMAQAKVIPVTIKQVHQIYVKRGFIIQLIEADGQFEPLCGELSVMGSP